MPIMPTPIVVSYEFSTSNHNSAASLPAYDLLYLMSFLHQTTTLCNRKKEIKVLYLMSFLHQTTTVESSRQAAVRLYLMSFLHQTTTSGLLFTYFQEVASILRHTKRILNYQRSVFDVIFLTTANILKKF